MVKGSIDQLPVLAAQPKHLIYKRCQLLLLSSLLVDSVLSSTLWLFDLLGLSYFYWLFIQNSLLGSDVSIFNVGQHCNRSGSFLPISRMEPAFLDLFTPASRWLFYFLACVFSLWTTLGMTILIRYDKYSICTDPIGFNKSYSLDLDFVKSDPLSIPFFTIFSGQELQWERTGTSHLKSAHWTILHLKSYLQK